MTDFICTDCGASVVSYDSGFYFAGNEDDRRRCLTCVFIAMQPEPCRARLRALLHVDPQEPAT